MTEHSDPLTDADADKILRGILEIAGRAGMEKPEIERRFHAIANHVREMKFNAALYETFEHGETLLDIDDEGELRIYSAKRIAERNSTND